MRRKYNVDWMLWVFQLGQPTEWIAQQMKVPREEVRAVLDSVFAKETKWVDIGRTLMTGKPWNTNQDLILKKCNRNGWKAAEVASLLARPHSEIKRRWKQLTEETPNG